MTEAAATPTKLIRHRSSDWGFGPPQSVCWSHFHHNSVKLVHLCAACRRGERPRPTSHLLPPLGPSRLSLDPQEMTSNVDEEARTTSSSCNAKRPVPPLDPKIIDDSTDSESSSDSDTDHSPSSDLRLQHATVLGVKHARTVTSLSLEPSGNRLATASVDGLVKLWDLHTMDSSLRPFRQMDYMDTKRTSRGTGTRITLGTSTRTRTRRHTCTSTGLGKFTSTITLSS